MFQLTAARRRLAPSRYQYRRDYQVSTHSRPKAAGVSTKVNLKSFVFQLTAARRRLDFSALTKNEKITVSTHSRPKAAGYVKDIQATRRACFNSQPPEGGWTDNKTVIVKRIVSTHSRPKAAGSSWSFAPTRTFVSTHSRPKAAG